MCAQNSLHEIPPFRPARDFIFKGKWLVRYDPAEFNYAAILALLPALQDCLQQQKLNPKYINLNFNSTVIRNRFFSFADHVFILHNGSGKRLLETDPGAFAVQTNLEPLSSPIGSLNLFFPRLNNDRRWKTMGLPASQLFLASALQGAGFRVSPRFLSLPAAQPLAEELSADMVGFSLFEDLLPQLMPFFTAFHALYHGWLAVGGPFITLAPMAAVTHLPQANLFVRGEIEQELPLILDALNRGDAEALLRQKGLFWQQPGLIVMADFDRVNRPETFSRFQVNLDFLRREHLTDGLEMNFSRGCNRGCLFCCHAQGRKYRKLPLDKAEELLRQYRDRVNFFFAPCRGVPLERPDDAQDMPGRPTGSPLPMAMPNAKGRPVNFVYRQIISAEADDLCCGSPIPKGESPAGIPININDDDILQDPLNAAAVFALIKKHGFRIHGIQTAPAAFMEKDDQVRSAVLDLVGDRDLYVDNRPLLWLGSDVFLSERARRLGKKLPSAAAFSALLGEFEKRGLRHFHYWISSDSDSTWEELVEELGLIFGFFRDFSGFGLLAHAPFIVPYPSSRLFQRLKAGNPRLKFKLALKAADPRFSYQVVERLETRWPQLNRLLRNEKAGGEKGFFDFLKEKDFKAAAQLTYHFLKQEELQSLDPDSGLIKARERLEKTIAEILENRNT